MNLSSPIEASSEESELNRAQVEEICRNALAGADYEGKRVLAVIPDQTRSCPLDMLFEEVCGCLMGRAVQLDFLVALGTHPPMSIEQIYHRVGITADDHREKYPEVRFFNHAWDDPDQLVKVGTLSREEIGTLTDGRFEMNVDVTVNRLVQNYDLLLIMGPVFPHEVVGFSGGNKYIFPGIGGPELLNFFHWLGAVITNPKIIGTKWTPVRKVVDRAAAMVPIARRALCMVVKGKGLSGLYYGTPEEAWSAAADLSQQVHVHSTERAYHTVLSCAPKMYDELWVGAKCMYKLEPAVADGGRLIIYAPHIREVATVHDRLIREIGYHTRDYFLEQWDRFKDIPWGILAHSTHVKGVGTYKNGVETPRIEVILATGISEETCREINLGYLDPDTIRVEDYQDREEEGILYVAQAGEMLYRYPDAGPELGGTGSPQS